MTPHIVSTWLRQLRTVRHGTLRAYKNTRLRLLDMFPDPESWTADETRLVLMLFRPTAQELEEFIQDCLGAAAEDLDDADVASAGVFAAYLREPFSEPGLTRPTQLFAIDALTNGACTSSSVGWRAIALTEELALLCEDFDEYTNPLFPRVLGAITRQDLTRSAALLIRAHGEWDASDSGFYCEVQAEGIAPAEVYRILLARSNRGGTRILTMDPEQLKQFRTRHMAYDFESLMAVMRSSEDGKDPQALQPLQPDRMKLSAADVDTGGRLPIRAAVYFAPDPDPEFQIVLCETCGPQNPDAHPGVLFDARGYLCHDCALPLDVVGKVH